MKLEGPDTRWRRQAILRGVYEDNLKMADKQVRTAGKKIGRPGWWLWGTRLALAVTGLLVLFGGVQVYREMQTRQAPPPTPAERMDQEFRSPDDPGAYPDPDAQGLFGTDRELPIASLFDLQVKTIVIDPGHGGIDPGAIGPSGTREKDITLDVARRLKRRLERGYGFTILMTREDDHKVTRHQRVAFANEHDADLFISIHVNAFRAERVNVIETFYFGMQADEQTLQLAALENKASEISNAEFQDTLEKFGKTMKFQESKQLATSIQKTLYRNIRSVNSDVGDWGAKPGPFTVLLGVEVPSVLAEISVISNKAEEAKLNTPEYREQLAMALEAGLVSYLHPEPSEPIDETTEHARSEKDDDD